jgi:hypothetical protein
MKLYALYKGDEFIDIGTSKELAKKLNVKIETIWFYMSEKWKERSNYESWVIVEVGDEDNEEEEILS